ncbi:MAG TPA: YncE family protein [Trebonia sp.]|jgi:YVTN family beta-propeller protein|nr:YncE family protein [Trebonia sp.]
MTGDLLLVASQSGEKLDFFDVDTLERLDTIGLLAQPHEMAYDPVRRLVYVAHTYRAGGYNEGKPKAHEISVVDPDARRVIDVIDISPFEAAHDVDYDPGADRIYASVERNGAGNGLIVIDARTREVETSIPLDPPNAHWLSLTPDGAKAYVTHKEAPFVSVVDLRDRRLLTTIPSPGGAEEVDCSPDGRYAVVGAPMMTLVINVARGGLTKGSPPPGTPRPRLLKIDVATDEVVGVLEFDEYQSALRVGPDGRVAVSEFRFPAADAAGPAGPAGPACGRTNIVDLDSLELLASVQLDELPFTVRFRPDGQAAYVANVKSGSVSVVDLASYRVTATLDSNVGAPFGGTHGLCVVPGEQR